MSPSMFLTATKYLILKSKFLILGSTLAIAGCATQPYNYEKFREAKPRSILVLPPINNSTDVRGTYSYLSTITQPLTEKGYYVYPVVVIDHMMKENGLPTANEMHQASLKKIKEILNPDAVLYLTLESYGTKFILLDSQTTVAVSGKLVSTLNGEVIWDGRVVTTKSSSSNGGGLAQMLVTAVVSQAANSATDYAHRVSSEANATLFFNPNNGLLNGPYNVNPNP